MRKLSMICFFVFVAATSGGATECGQVITDPGFDAWCGDTLCNWQVLVEDSGGGIERAPTWHAKDIAVSLVNDVEIFQTTDVEGADGHCIKFSLVADIAAEAAVILTLDINNDSSPDWTQTLPVSNWRPLSYRIRMPPQYRGVTFKISKYGPGRAVIANIEGELAPDEECSEAAQQRAAAGR
jgi:hypothetical protein